MEKYKKYHLIDKYSNIVIYCSGKNEEEAREFVKLRLKEIDRFSIEGVE